LVDFDPAYKPRVEAFYERLWGNVDGLTQVAPTPIHSAFRLSQLLLVDGKFALIDIDGFVLGNPIADVGSFVAHLLYVPLKSGITFQQSLSAIRIFCRSYAERAPWGLPPDVLAWQTAAHLVGQHARQCIRREKENYRSKVDQLLNTATKVLSGKLSLM
jgi:hypothetical protein